MVTIAHDAAMMQVIPGTCELVRLTECGCSTAEVLRMELCILDKLRWTLRASQTSLEFIQLVRTSP